MRTYIESHFLESFHFTVMHSIFFSLKLYVEMSIYLSKEFREVGKKNLGLDTYCIASENLMHLWLEVSALLWMALKCRKEAILIPICPENAG